MAKEKMCGIYCIENIVNHKKYIGQSVNIQNRFYDHKGDLRRGLHKNEHLQNSWNKYGEENFKFYVVELCNETMLDTKEQYYIDKYDTYTHAHGYNIELGGKGKGKVPNSIKQKISKHHIDVSGKNNPFYGKHHSQNTLNQILNSDGYLHRKIYGEDNHSVVLTMQEVIEIKKYLKNNILKNGDIKKIAKKYNVSSNIISRIKNNITWKWVNV